MTEPTPDCSDEPKLTAEEWEAVAVLAEGDT